MQIQIHSHIHGHCCWSVRKSCWTHCDLMDCSTPDSLPFTIIHVFDKYIWYAVKMSMTSGGTHTAVVMVNSRNNTCFNYRHINIDMHIHIYSLPGGSDGEESTGNVGPEFIPGLGRPPGGRHGNPLQYSGLENPMDRWAWQPTVQGVAKSQASLSN